MGGIRSTHHTTKVVDTVCVKSGRYYTADTASIVDAEVVRFYEQQCHPASGCAWPAFPQNGK